MTAITALSGIEHIQTHPSLYLGEEISKTVLCSDYIGAFLTVAKITTDKDYKIICEILHNAFDNIRKEMSGNIWISISEGSITIKNTTNMKVEDHHSVFGVVKSCKTLDLILDTMFTSSNFQQKDISTAGMYGIGLKVVIALTDFSIIELNDTKSSHVKEFNRGIESSNILEGSSSKESFFSITIPLAIDLGVVVGLAKEIAAFNNQPISVIADGYIYDLQIPSLDDIIQAYASSLQHPTKQTIWLDDKLEIQCIIGHQSNASILLSNGIRSTSGSWLATIMRGLQKCYEQYYDGTIEKGKLSVIGYIQTNNCELSFNSNDKDKIVTRFKQCSDLSIPKQFFTPLQQAMLSKQVTKAVNSINLKKISSYSPPTKKPITLMILEGEGAKTSISYSIDRAITGTFTTTGKIPNLDKSVSALTTNPTIAALVKIIDLNFHEIVIACDPDPDGYHIIGLLLNFLSRANDMLARVKVIIFPLYKTKEHGFSFVEAGTVVKYFKGLGSYSRHEIAEVMSNDNLLLPLEDSNCHYYEVFKMFFERDSQIRKKLFNDLDTNMKIEDILSQGVLSWHYVCIMLRQFMQLAILRSIPAIDGLNSTKRKAIFGSMSCKTPQKVTVLCSKITSLTDYPHGEKSLQGVVIKMGQDFPCSNWIALMENDGAFGSRRMGGEDAASPRYLYTQLSQAARSIFLDEYQGIIESEETGEPQMYLPLYPILLINGCNALGVGFRSNIPPHSPEEVIQWLKDRHNGIMRPIPDPKYNGFKGNVFIDRVDDGKEKLITTGIMEVNDGYIHISEIPPTMTIAKMIDWLNDRDYDFLDTSSPDEVDITINEVDVERIKAIEAILIKRIPIECKIVSYEDKIRILDLTRQELFEHFYKQSIYFFDLLKKKRVNDASNLVSKYQSISWCVKHLMNVEFVKIDKVAFLSSKISSDMTWFDNSTIEIDYRVSQLTTKYLGQLSAKIEALTNTIQQLNKSSILDMWW